METTKCHVGDIVRLKDTGEEGVVTHVFAASERCTEFVGTVGFGCHVEDLDLVSRGTGLIAQVEQQVAQVRAFVESGDYESAHACEDDLRSLVLQSIVDIDATISGYPRQEDYSRIISIAKMALSTKELQFTRHCG